MKAIFWSNKTTPSFISYVSRYIRLEECIWPVLRNIHDQQWKSYKWLNKPRLNLRLNSSQKLTATHFNSRSVLQQKAFVKSAPFLNFRWELVKLLGLPLFHFAFIIQYLQREEYEMTRAWANNYRLCFYYLYTMFIYHNIFVHYFHLITDYWIHICI